MNSKKLCCICVLFSLLAGCASESSIDEKKKKAQVTQSNINKNTPQQLPDKDLFGNETPLAVTAHRKPLCRRRCENIILFPHSLVSRTGKSL